MYQLAMIPLLGWDYIDVVSAEGLHPLSYKSKVLVALVLLNQR